MNSSVAAAAELSYARFLGNFIVQFNRYVPIPLLLLGVIGNILNILILKRPSLRSNPCSICFIAASLVNLLVLIDGLIPRILLSFDKDPSDTNDFLCKVKYYVIYSSSALSSWFIVLATIDRYLSSSLEVWKRRLSSIQQNQWRILGLVIFAVLFFIDKFVCFVANIQNEPLKCNVMKGACRDYHNYSYIVVYSLVPCVLMAIFGTLTILNVRKARMTVAPQQPGQAATNSGIAARSTTSNRDRQLISMLLVQIVLLILFSFPISSVRTYLGATGSIVKSPLRLAQESFALQFVIMLTYIPIIDTFYIYVVWGSIFRKELRIMARSWMRALGAPVAQVTPLQSGGTHPTTQK